MMAAIRIGVLLFAALLSACGGSLPKAERISSSPWQTFDEAKAAYDQIFPGSSTREDLRFLGFDPYETPNIRILNYLELLQRFMPNESITFEYLPTGVSDCLQERDRCTALLATPGRVHSERHGNLVMDMLSFDRQTLEQGWAFEALIVFKDDLVVYKLWSGQPKIEERSQKRQPLGPLQDAGGLLRKQVGN